MLSARAAAIAVAMTTALPVAAAENRPSWGAELRLGGYRPHVGNKSERIFYKQVHGTASPVMIGLELQRFLDYRFGLIGVFFRVSQWKHTGRAQKCTDPATGGAVACSANTVGSAIAGADKSSLLVIPFSVGALYRLDILKQRWNLPLTAYGKLGLDYFLWRETKSGDLEKTPSGDDANGGVPGAHAAVGLSLGLDWIDPGSGQRKSFLNSHVFAEITQYWANGFGDSAELDMSDRQYNFGLSFDFL